MRTRVHVDDLPAHRVHEHIGGLQVCGRVWVARLPPFELFERLFPSRRPSNLDQRVLWYAASSRNRARSVRLTRTRRLNSPWLAGLFPVLRRPGRVAKAFLLVSCRQFEKCVERAWMLVDLRVPIADRLETEPASLPW